MREAMPADTSPVFVVGVAHSGTTILHRMLAYHPEFAWFSQFSLRSAEIPGRFRVPGASRLDRVLRSIPHRWQKEKAGLRRLVVPRPGEAWTIWAHLLEDGGEFASVEELAQPARSSANRKLGDDTIAVERVRSCLSAFSERFGGRPVLAKVPHSDFYRFLAPLLAACPDARFVHIVRDGRPVAFSLRPKFERRLDRHDALLAGAKHWVDSLEQVHATPGIGLLEVRYEDLCEDVHGVIRTVLRHAGLDAEPFPFHRCPPRLSQTNTGWVEKATTEELTTVSEIQHDLLNRYAYPLVPQAASGRATKVS